MNYQHMEETPTSSVINKALDPAYASRRPLRRTRSVYSTYIPNKRFSRYNNTLYSLLPFRTKSNTELAVQNCGLFSFITFHWIWKYLWDSVKNNASDSVPSCPKADSCKENSKRLDGLLNIQFVNQGKIGSSMISVVWKFIRTRTIFASLLYTFASILSMIGLIFFLPKILCNGSIFHGNSSNAVYKCEQPLNYMFALIATEMLACLLLSGSVAINLRTAIRLRSACFALLFRQAMSTLLTYKLSSWQLVSFLLADGQHIQDLVMAIPNLICAPIVILCCMLFAGIHLQLWGYLSVVIILLFFPVFIIIALLSKNLLQKASFFSDQRIRYLEEYIVKNIYVKIFKQEESFEKNISDNRQKELKYLTSAGFYDNFCFSFVQLQPLLSLSALFIAYDMHPNASHEKLPEFAAICIILLIHVKQSLDNFWYALNSFIKGLAALNKFKNIMTLETVQFNRIVTLNDNLAISIKSGNFQWVKQDTLDYTNNIKYKNKKDYINFPRKRKAEDILCDIDIDIEKIAQMLQGALIGICGPPGSGKSSLLLAIMGLLLHSKGSREINGSFAYVSQEPFIFHASLKNNIIFGEEFNVQKYYRVTMHCNLTDDVANFYNNDETFVDSKHLSMEQKQKIALARALYSDSDIYLLDEPLSTIEFDKCLEMFDTCIMKSLQEKTRLLVTNKTELLEKCTRVYFLKDGKIVCEGNHSEMEEREEEYKYFIQHLDAQKNYYRDKSRLCEAPAEIPITPNLYHYPSCRSIFNSAHSIDSTASDNCPFKMNEKRSDKQLYALNNILISYISYIGNFGAMISLFFGHILNSVFISLLPIYFIISLEYPSDDIMFLGIYFGLFVLMLIMGAIMNFFFNKKMFTVSTVFHDELITKLFKATLLFFQSRSLGIISTVLLYLHLTDIEIPRIIHNILLNIFLVLMTCCLMCIISPWYLINLFIFFLIMGAVTCFVRRALLNFNEFNMNYSDNLYNQIVTMLSARSVIQAYNRINDFSIKLHSVYDDYISYTYIIHAAKCWLNYFLQSISVALLASVGIVAIIFAYDKWLCMLWDILLANHSDSSIKEVSCLALTMVCIFQVCFSLQRFFLLYVNAGVAFDMLSRVQLFKQNIPEESAQSILVNEEEIIEKCNNSIQFCKVTFCIQNDTIPILKDMSFKIKSSEKIGFLGLTSLERKAIIAILYKFSNLSFGNVIFGDSSISQISVSNLRSFISIIPVEPFLFKETVKNVLTCNGNLTDDMLINLLQKFSLWEYINQLPNKIDSVVETSLNSDGKQILCLAQAYARQSSVLIIEDVVSGSHFEYMLRLYLRDFFPQTTVIIFANDLKSLVLCDRVAVIEQEEMTSVKVIKESNFRQVNEYDVSETNF